MRQIPTIAAVRGQVPAGVRREILALLAAATAADAVPPVSEAPLLALEAGDPTWTHVTARIGGDLVAYVAADDARAGIEGVVAPAHRRQGIGRAILQTLRGAPGELRAWAHGDLPAARGFAAAVGATRVRQLLSMRTEITPPTGSSALAAGEVGLREFVEGEDSAAWVELNALAFANHPEQGALGAVDLARRLAQPWYVAGDLIMAVTCADGEGAASAAGYVWVKVDPDDEGVGEIYALGVHPEHRGRGLGAVLLEAGLARIAARGLGQAKLYVDADNAAAVRLYQRRGFRQVTADAVYALPAAG
ncbi:MAG: mycothiol synthase [Bifidobacteriaceae bacterium]|jgi:mycothiol synthase|nr:mycothiol synthase [Bifidobacteriaceae bacterium]